MDLTAPTTDQIREAWDAVADGFDEHVTPLNLGYADDALARVGLAPGKRFLDVAAGSGSLAIPAARLGAYVVATDLSPRMVERLAARAQEEGLSTVETRVMDGCDLDLPDDGFDVAASQNGVSLFPDLGRGLAELVRVTKPGGQVMIVAFGPLPRAEFITFFVGALTAAVDGFNGPPMDPPPLPFQVADPGVLTQRLADAGLSDIGVDQITWSLPVRSGQHLWDLVLASNPIAGRWTATLTPEQVTGVTRVLDGMLRERSGGAPTAVLTAEVNIGIGTK